MASRIPFNRSISWVALLPQFALLFGLFYVFHRLDADRGILYGALVYLNISFILKLTIVQAHRLGIRAVKRLDFKQAISSFERSYAFLDRHRWIDEWRSITLLSASAMSYREMALVNIAFCHGQLGDGEACRSWYERALQEYPQNAIARTALNMIRSVSGSA